MGGQHAIVKRTVYRQRRRRNHGRSRNARRQLAGGYDFGIGADRLCRIVVGDDAQTAGNQALRFRKHSIYAQPYGPFEVLAGPSTITNSGARDGAVLSLQLEAKNPATGQIEKFKSSYVADAQYFGSRDDVAERLKRPKIPFAPISVSGRSAFTGTILFLSFGFERKKSH